MSGANRVMPDLISLLPNSLASEGSSNLNQNLLAGKSEARSEVSDFKDVFSEVNAKNQVNKQAREDRSSEELQAKQAADKQRVEEDRQDRLAKQSRANGEEPAQSSRGNQSPEEGDNLPQKEDGGSRAEQEKPDHIADAETEDVENPQASNADISVLASQNIQAQLTGQSQSNTAGQPASGPGAEVGLLSNSGEMKNLLSEKALSEKALLEKMVAETVKASSTEVDGIQLKSSLLPSQKVSGGVQLSGALGEGQKGVAASTNPNLGSGSGGDAKGGHGGIAQLAMTEGAKESKASSERANADFQKTFADLKAKVGSNEWNNQISQRVKWLTQNNGQFAEIRLDPPEMGSLNVKIKVNADQTVAVTFSPQHAHVKESLEQNVDRLRELLSSQGLDLVDVDVSDQSLEQGETGEGGNMMSDDGDEHVDFDGEDAVETTVQVRKTEGLVDDYV